MQSLNDTVHRRHMVHWNAFVTLLVMLLTLLAGCQTPESLPTPTPTRTPIIPTATPTLIPTLTPTPTPTNTPTPTPTLPADLALPPAPRTVLDWSVLPADLYFIRNGRINIWLSEGTHIEIPLLAEDNDAAVQSYHVIPGGRYITYITTTGKLYKLDRATWQHIYIPTSGYLIENNKVLYEATSNGELTYYLAWGTQPSSTSSPQSATPSGTILGINTSNPQLKQNTIGFCQGAYDIPCLDLALSPDESQMAYIDGLGIWLAPVSEGRPSLLATHSHRGIYTKLYWSPDGRWLLLTGETSNVVLVSTSAINGEPQTLTVCEGSCKFASSWVSNSLWFIINKTHQTCLIEINPDVATTDVSNNQADRMNTICQLDLQDLDLVALETLQDNRVFFQHQGCEKPCDGLAAGLYVRNNDNSIIPIALIDNVGGKMIWTSDGSAFLYVGTNNSEKYIGLLNEQAYLDAANLLLNATDFQWVETTAVGD